MPTPTPTGAAVATGQLDHGGSFGASGLWATLGSHLYLSIDDGASWVERNLVPSFAPSSDECDCLSNVFVLDATHAWLASPGPGSTPYDGQGPLIDHLHVVVSRTSNGGQTWRSVTVPGDWGGSEPVLAFADDRHGYLLMAGLRGGGGSAVLATADGGLTWRLMGGSSGIGRLGSIFGVTSPATLWSGNQGDAGPVERPILDVSRDGGRSWADARLPGLIGDIYVTDTLVAPPVIGGLDGALAVLIESSPSGSEFRFFRTTDAGLSWVQAARVAQNDNNSVAVAVIDAMHFIVLDPEAAVVRSTTDGGRTWQVSPMSGISGWPEDAWFWDQDHGIVVISNGNGRPPSLLYRTIDGGRTWLSVPITTTP